MSVAIVGAGPAGAAAAIALARAGRRPLLLERDSVIAEKVCGEFLAEDAVRRLAVLGVDVAALGAVPIRRAVFAAGSAQAELPLPFAAWSLPRATLDAALVEAARRAGAEVRLGTPVSRAERQGAGWRLRLPDGELDAEALVLATGKHELRGHRRARPGGAIGVKLPLLGEVADATVTLLSCTGGYAGLQKRPGGANLCAALDPDTRGVAEVARNAVAFLEHVMHGSALAARLLAGLVPAQRRPLVVGGIPYGHVAQGGEVFRVGDQASVIPSFCGDGVAMALASGQDAAAALLAGVEPAAYQAAWARRIGNGMRVAGLVEAVHRRTPRLLLASMTLAPGLIGWAAQRTRLGEGG